MEGMRVEQAVFQMERLNRLMEDQGVESSELAEWTGLSYNYVYLLRRGDRPIVSAVNLAMIAAALGCSVEYLVGLTENPLPAIGQDVGADEVALLACFRRLSACRRRDVTLLAGAFLSANGSG